MMEKHRTKDGSDNKEDLDKAKILYSDEMECFNIFKEKTHGIIYQRVKVPISKYNLHAIANASEGDLKIVEAKKGSGRRGYIYEYLGKEYKTLNALNKEGVYFKKEIKFDSILDLIPYYPYIVAFAFADNDSAHIEISLKSYVDEAYDVGLRYGVIPTSTFEHYKKCLQEHYLDVVFRYFNEDGRAQGYIEKGGYKLYLE